MNPPTTAPKDQLFLGDFGWPTLCLTLWNDAMEEWTYPALQINLLHGQWNDPYWETEYEPPDALRGWLPLPTNQHYADQENRQEKDRRPAQKTESGEERALPRAQESQEA